MKYAHDRPAATKRQPVNISLSQELVAEAKLSGLNISAISEAALSIAVQDARLAIWAAQNKSGFMALNKLTEEEGLPLADLALL